MNEPTRMLDVAQRLMKALRPGDLDATLQALTSAAVEVLPQAEYSSVTVVHDDGRVETVAPTHELLVGLDEAQGRLREGPCFEAAVDQVHVIAGDLAADERFPNYGPLAVAEGIHSQAGIRLFDAPGSQGSLNLYSGTVGAFDDIESLAALFSHQAGIAIAYAREVDNLRAAVETRTRIGQATGIVMERYGLSDDRAFAFLTRLSQSRNVKLRIVADEIVAENTAPTSGAGSPGTENTGTGNTEPTGKA